MATTPTSAAPTTSASPSESGTVDPTPTEDATTASPSATDSPSASGEATAPARGSLRSRLLAADEVPGFNSTFRWAEGATRGREPADGFGTCQRFALTSIGAERVVVRDFAPADASATGDSAGELVASFPDTATARRAFEVLKSWRARCADRIADHDRSRVGRLQDVAVDGGTGGWYLLTYGPTPDDPDAGWFDAQGLAVVGTRVVLMEMVVVGQDYNYPRGREPMVAAVRRAAARLS